MTEPTPARRTVYFDGRCQLCSREIELFRRLVPDGSLATVDIADPAFDAVAHGLDPVAVHKTMHVRNDRGDTLTGVDALVAMWEVVPHFRWLARFTRLPGVRQAAEPAYRLFAWVRPQLPKRRRCESGTCRV